MLIWFEDMLADPVAALRQLAGFVGVELSSRLEEDPNPDPTLTRTLTLTLTLSLPLTLTLTITLTLTLALTLTRSSAPRPPSVARSTRPLRTSRG